MKEVADRASGPLSEPTPQAIIEKHNILSDDSQGKVSATVSGATEWAPVAVDEKPLSITGVVHRQVIVEQKLSQVCTRLEERSHFQRPLDIVEKLPLLLGEVLDSEKVTVRAARARAPVVLDRKPDDVRTVVPLDVEQKLSDVGSRGRWPCIRQGSRGAIGVDDMEWVGDTGEMGVASALELPEMVRDKRSVVIRRAIASLPERIRETFILHFYEELSHTEIVERQGISSDCVGKGISQAAKKLKQRLRGYFIDSEVAVSGTATLFMDVNGSGQKQEGRQKSPTPLVSGEKQKSEEPEVMMPEIAPKNLHGWETMTKSVSDECVEEDVAEKSEFMHGAGSPLALVGEKIADVAHVCGENPLSPMMPVMLSPPNGWIVPTSLMPPVFLPSLRPDEIVMGREGGMALTPYYDLDETMRSRLDPSGKGRGAIADSS